VNININFVGGHAGFYGGTSQTQNFSGNCSSMTHSCNYLWRFDCRLVPSNDFTSIGIGRAGDAGWHVTTRAYFTRLHATFEWFMTAFVFSSTATPASIIC
jgi:hypothetical protein